jgi:hypothetical protein
VTCWQMSPLGMSTYEDTSWSAFGQPMAWKQASPAAHPTRHMLQRHCGASSAADVLSANMHRIPDSSGSGQAAAQRAVLQPSLRRGPA